MFAFVYDCVYDYGVINKYNLQMHCPTIELHWCIQSKMKIVIILMVLSRNDTIQC